MSATKRQFAMTLGEAMESLQRALALVDAQNREIGRLQRELFEARVSLHYARRLEEAKPASERVQ